MMVREKLKEGLLAAMREKNLEATDAIGQAKRAAELRLKLKALDSFI